MSRLLIMAGLAAGLSSAAAHAASYTFADASGTPFCNTIRLTQSHGIAAGLVDGSACKPASTLIGAGVQTSVPGGQGKLWSFGAGIGKYASLILLDENALIWSLYTASHGGGFQLHLVEGGTLLPGRDAARPGARSILSR